MSEEEGPAPGRWARRGSRQLYASDWVNLWIDDVDLPGGRQIAHHVVRLPRRSVSVVVLDEQDRVLLIWRHRFITNRWGWEVPAGWLEEGEDSQSAASREVEEETGWLPKDLRQLAQYDTQPGLSDHHFTVYLAQGATPTGHPPDPEEAAAVEWIPLARFPDLLREGKLLDGVTVTALALARSRTI